LCPTSLFYLHIKSEINNISVQHSVLLAFQTDMSGLPGLFKAAIFLEVAVCQDLGPDKSLLYIRVYGASGLKGRRLFNQKFPGLFRQHGGDLHLETAPHSQELKPLGYRSPLRQ